MRDDIQSLRGVATILVFCFHLFPTLFVNGYLGVDIIFVISGYLMAKTLTKTRISKVKDFFHFYYRRSRRVLPLHFIVTFFTLLLVHLRYWEFRWIDNQMWGLSSLFCAMNQLIIFEGDDYFNMLLSNKFTMNAFTHSWSLSVEMQFFLIVPFIFFGLQFLNNDMLRLMTVSTLTVVGFIAFTVVSALNSQFAFNFMLLRLWQFSAGFVVFYWNKLNDSTTTAPENSKNTGRPSRFVVTKEDIVGCSLVVLSFCILPTKFNPLFLRPFVTVATALVIANESDKNKMLQSSLLSYLGDLSFAIYLVHWPFISIFLGSTVRSYVFCVATTLVIASFLHHFIERRFRRFGVKMAILLMVILLCFNGYLQQSVRKHSIWRNIMISGKESMIERNHDFLPDIWSTERKIDPCTERMLPNVNDRDRVIEMCRYPVTHGSFPVMMIGNSYVLNFNEHTRHHFHYNYSHYKYVSMKESYGLYADSENSQVALNLTKQEVQTFKPDVLFIVARYSQTIKRRFTGESDGLLRQMNENIAFYEKIVKKIYILEPHPTTRLEFLNIFLHYATQRPEELETLHLNRKDSEMELRHAKKRFQMMKCKKCRYFDVGHMFLENDQYLTFDRDQMLSYVDNSLHLTAHGIRRCEPVLKSIVEEIMKNM